MRDLPETVSNPPERPVTTMVAAHWLGIHPKTVLEYVRDHGLPCHPLPGGRNRYYLSEVSRWHKQEGRERT
jgi:predicted site-specific integrase-resolvase